MTDNYGSDPHADEANADHEQDVTQEAEVWHDNQPPVDDFADHPPEETATVSEETEILGEETEVTEIPRKKVSLLLPLVAGIGGLLFLGALLYWQFGAAPTPTGQTAQLSSPPPLSTETPASADTAAAKPAPISSNGSADISSLKQPAEDVTPTTAMAPVADASAPPSSPAPVVPSVSTSPPVVSPSIPATVPLSPPSATIAAAPVKNDAVEQRLNILSAHVEDLQKSLTQATQQLSQVSNMIAANPPSAQSSPALEDRLGKIEQQLEQMQHNAPTVTSPPMAASESSTVAELAPKKSAAKPSAHVTHKASSKTARHKKSQAVAHKSTPHATVAISPSPHWILRAATPDEAWVATNDFSPELRHIQIGDTLTGIGRVLAIHQNGDNWVIEGSQGTVQ